MKYQSLMEVLFKSRMIKDAGPLNWATNTGKEQWQADLWMLKQAKIKDSCDFLKKFDQTMISKCQDFMIP